MTAAKFRKKPVEVEVMHWVGAPTRMIVPSATKILDWVLANGGSARYHEENVRLATSLGLLPTERYIAIETPEGTMRALPGDYIIRGVDGYFYPCVPDSFEQSYELVVEQAHS